MIRVDKLDLQRSLPPFTKQVDDLRVRCLVKVAVMRANSVERFGQDQAHHLVALMGGRAPVARRFASACSQLAHPTGEYASIFQPFETLDFPSKEFRG